MASVLYIISIYTPTLSPLWFHPVTLSHYAALLCAPTYPPPCPATSTLPPPSPCTAWGGVRTCRLPLIWVSAIQFSGRYKPAQCHTPPPPISLSFPGHKACRQPYMVLKVPTHTPLPLHRYPSNCTEFLCLNLKTANLAVELLCWIANRILMHRLWIIYGISLVKILTVPWYFVFISHTHWCQISLLFFFFFFLHLFSATEKRSFEASYVCVTWTKKKKKFLLYIWIVSLRSETL